MKNLFIWFVLTIFVAMQSLNASPNPINTNISFPGGLHALKQYIYTNLDYPLQARENAIEGDVVVAFLINIDGTVSNAFIENGIDPDCDAAVLELIENMPKWKVSQNKKKARPAWVKLKITFQLTV